MAATPEEFMHKDGALPKEKTPIVTAVFSNYTQFFDIKSDDTTVPSNCVSDRGDAPGSQFTAFPGSTQFCAGMKSVDQEPSAEISVQSAGQMNSEECTTSNGVSQSDHHISVRYKVSHGSMPLELSWKCPCGRVIRKVINFSLFDCKPKVVTKTSEGPPTVPSGTPETTPTVPMETTETPPTSPLGKTRTPSTVLSGITESSRPISLDTTQTPPTIQMETTETLSTVPSGMTETPPTVPTETPPTVPTETPPTVPTETPPTVPTETPPTVPTETPPTVPTETPPTVPTETPPTVPTETPPTVPTEIPPTVPTETPPTVPTETPPTVPTETPPTVPTETPPTVPTETPPTVPTETPPTVPTETPPTVPTETPPTVPTETPPTVPTETPPIVPSETPPTVPTETPPIVPSETPPTVPSDTPPTVPSETSEILDMEVDQEVVDKRPDSSVKTHSRKKPDRFCPYCKSIITGGKLKRHIFKKHRHEPEVRFMKSKPSPVQNQFLDVKRREGMYEYNLQLIGDGLNPEMRARKPAQKDQLRVCSACKGFYSKKTFYKHKCVTQRECLRQAFNPKLMKEVTPGQMGSDQGFLRILNGFREGEVGDFCREDKTIKMIGYKHYVLLQHEKKSEDEIRKKIMLDMRELSKLYLRFQSLSSINRTVEDMFRRECLPDVVEALKQLVTKEDKGEKHGLKAILYTVLLRSLKIQESYYDQTMQYGKKKELTSFRSAFKRLSRDSSPNLSPSSPIVQKVLQVKEYIAAEICSTLKNYLVEKFAWLRSLVIARLTLFNARRGEDISRMLVSEWDESENGTQHPDKEIVKVTDQAEQYLVGQFMLAYLKAKRKKYVPILIPKDLLSAIQVIRRDRCKFGVREDNPFLFATKNSPFSHCSGWRAVTEVCGKRGISMSTEIKSRCRLSSVYASLDMAPGNRERFLQLVGYDDPPDNREGYHASLGDHTTNTKGRVPSSVSEDQPSERDVVDGSSTRPVISDSGPAMTIGTSDTCPATNTGTSDTSPVTTRETSDTSPVTTRGTSDTSPVRTRGTSDTSPARTRGTSDTSPARTKGTSDTGPARNTGTSGTSPVRTRGTSDTSPARTRGTSGTSPAKNTGTSGTSPAMTKGISVRWSKEETTHLRKHFKGYISKKMENNTGNLPSKHEIQEFLKANTIQALEGLDNKTQVLKVRTKIFNERKTTRQRVNKMLHTLGISE